MGAAWFKLYPRDYLMDSKVRLLSRDHRSILLDLWCYCAVDGCIPSDPESLARLIGEPVSVVKKAMVKLGSFFVNDGGNLYSRRLKIECDVYEAKCQKLRSNGVKGGRPKKAKAKAKGLASENHLGDHSEKQLPTHLGGESESESESESLRDVCAEASPAQAEKLSSPVVIELPAVGSGAKAVPITEDQVAGWRNAFPGVDVLGELRKAKVWLEANPSRRKTARGIPAFVVSWLGRAQDRPGPSTATGGRASPLSPASGPRGPAVAALQSQVSALTFPTIPKTRGAPE